MTTTPPKPSRTYPAAPLLGASACIWRGNDVLLVLRTNPPTGVWSLPGGMVEVGETLEQAALRELAEETGIVAKLIALADWAEIIEVDKTRIKRHFVVPMFVGTYISGTIQAGDDAGDARWFNLDEIGKLDMTPDTADLIAKTYSTWVQPEK